MTLSVPRHIFRAYDIRGRTENELTENVAEAIGRAFATVAKRRKATVIVAGDVRLSTESLRTHLVKGLLHGGVDVIDIGTVPTPVLYFATHELNTGCGIMITGSHNPPEFNGLKFMLDGVPFADKDLLELYSLIEQPFAAHQSGKLTRHPVLSIYKDRIVHDISVDKPLRVGIDCGNGVTGVLVPQLFEAIGCEVTSLYAELDGAFPNHHPDPVKPSNLADLIEIVHRDGLDLGIAFDGDGDRLGVVTRTRQHIQADILLSYLAKPVLDNNPGSAIIFDVKSGRAATSQVQELGGNLVICKTGHTNVKTNLRSTGAKLGGEFSGHICFADRWFGFDDALYTACRLIERLSHDAYTLDEYTQSLDAWLTTPEIEINTTESRKFQIVEELQTHGDFAGATVNHIDGIRVDYEDRWGLLRASNTAPKLTLRFEAKNDSAMEQIKVQFNEQLGLVAPELHSVEWN
ncbi:MAG: phosphomannomutase/phosphoglucomutase [Gammaproteobacteria bacterium]|nr:phosphomannomutase/phosphoglucomutase [Gammaproteobacteria bacterium]MYF53997.1 phosphomannomutase/phosphoglucomutase [Gammaproteobacteria bacterium]MYK43962.1 phosphomannomutase/phosphoglucomutase [Gammaproteobacteria bacterium]